MAKRPTIIDVAKLAGVSKSTVSLVLQNSPSVKSDTREKVQAAMREAGYVYNRGAANLRGANAGLVGLFAMRLLTQSRAVEATAEILPPPIRVL